MSFGDFFGGITDAFKLGYNLFTNQRDFDYQKSLQQTMFEREDTAVQRRMEDLKAAGINPNLAAGSAAGAGSVVSRSNTNDLGSAIDTMMAVNSIKAQKQQIKNAELEGEILDHENLAKEWEAFERRMQVFNRLGVPFQLQYDYKTNKWETAVDFDKVIKPSDMPFVTEYNNNLKYLLNSNEYLQRELNWFTANQLNDYMKTLGQFVPKVNFGFKR